MSAHGSPEQIRAKLSHPVIDGDGHWIEYTPVFAERMRKVAGDKSADGFLASQRRIPDSLRLSIAELEYVTRQLGAKVGMFGSGIRRPLAAAAGADPEVARFAGGFDQLGIDSEHNYDPVWQKCQELGIAPTFHTGGRSFGLRNSPSNFTFNHIGHFAAAGHAVAKALFLGGVTRRFPDLRFGFLEGGVSWGCQLFADLIEHWERRGKKGLEYMDPTKLDRALLRKLVEQYKYDEIAAELERRDGWPAKEEDNLTGGVPVLDDYAACNITRKEDWIDLYATPFYFGCEADDRLNAVAFSKINPFGARINAIFSSDVGHFDVPDMRQVLPEAYELVEDELITADDFRDFTFANAVRLWGTVNPRFFEGTVVAKAAASVLGTAPARAAAE